MKKTKAFLVALIGVLCMAQLLTGCDGNTIGGDEQVAATITPKEVSVEQAFQAVSDAFNMTSRVKEPDPDALQAESAKLKSTAALLESYVITDTEPAEFVAMVEEARKTFVHYYKSLDWVADKEVIADKKTREQIKAKKAMDQAYEDGGWNKQYSVYIEKEKEYRTIRSQAAKLNGEVNTLLYDADVLRNQTLYTMIINMRNKATELGYQ